MTLQVIESNQIDKLFAILVKRIRENQHAPLAPNHMMITCFGVEQWLLKSLANELGVFVNGHFNFPIHFIQSIGALLNIESDKSYQIEVLHLRLFSLLKDKSIQQKIETLDSALCDYLYHRSDKLKEQRLWQTAQVLASAFDSYQWQRVEWLQLWEKHQSIQLGESLSVKQSIQAILWRALLNQQQADHDYLPRYHFIQKIITALEAPDSDISTHFQNGLSIWCVTPLMPPIWQVIQALSKHTHVDFYFLNPSMELWGENLYLPFVEERLKQREKADELYYQHHPLLMAMGQVGAQCQKQLLDVSELSIENHFIESSCHIDGSTTSLLTQIRKDILYDTPQQASPTIKLIEEDTSLQIHRFLDRQTELKELHNCIKSWLRQDPTRHWDDVLVLAPNIEDYVDWLPVIFADMPHSSPATKNQDCLDQAFDFLLTLFSNDQPININNLREFFAFSIVQEKLQALGIDDQGEHFLDSLYEIGFRWGMTDAQRSDHYFEHGLSLQSGLELLWVQTCSTHQWELFQWNQYTQLHNYIQQVITAYQLIDEISSASSSKSISSWIEIWHDWLRDFFHTETGLNTHQKELERIMQHFNHIQNNAHLAKFNTSISFASMRSLWQDISSNQLMNTHYLSGKMVFANLLDMHCVPFKFIALIGLDESFTQLDNPPLLDMTWQLPQPYDRSIEANNRYYFLECLHVCEEKLWLSYSINGSSNIINPAFPLSALIDYLHRNTINTELLNNVILEHNESFSISDQITPPENPSSAIDEQVQDNKHHNPCPDDRLLYCHQLSSYLIDPIKTFISSRGAKAMDRIKSYQLEEESSLNALDRAQWRVEFVKRLLTDETAEQAAKSAQLISQISQYAGIFSPEMIAQEMTDEMQKITHDIKTKFEPFSFTRSAQPTIYHYQHEHTKIHLCVQPQLISKIENSDNHLQQIFVSGGKLNIQKLLQLWLNHLVLNTIRPTCSSYLCFDTVSNKLKVNERKLPNISIQEAKQKLHDIFKLYDQLEHSCYWAPPHMTFSISGFYDKQIEISDNQNKIHKEFYDKDEKSPWIILLNNYQVYNLSIENKTWQDSLYYANQLWGKWL